MDNFPITIGPSGKEVLGIQVVSESECEFWAHKELNRCIRDYKMDMEAVARMSEY